jgi:hypothetical protein
MTVNGDKFIIYAARSARQGWDTKFAAMVVAQGDDHLIDETPSSEWDEQEWQW